MYINDKKAISFAYSNNRRKSRQNVITKRDKGNFVTNYKMTKERDKRNMF